MPKNNTSFNVKVETGQEVNGEILTLLRGYSPYELALKDGFVGTEEEWLASLVGEKGETGNGIENVVLNDDYTLTIIYTNGDQYTIPTPIRGEKGETGNGIESATLNPDYTLTLNFTNGGSYTTPSIRGLQGERGLKGDQGIQGETGISISRVKLNPDYTLTIYFTDETSHTTSSIRGIQGEKGEAGRGIEYVTVNADYSLTFKYTDGNTYNTPVLRGIQGVQGEKGDTGNGISSAVLNQDYTLTLNFTDGSSFTTSSIRGQTGERGEQGIQGEPGKGIVKTELNPDYTLTISFSDGSYYTTPSIRGERGIQGEKGKDGADGVGISSVIMNQDYTLTINFDDGTQYTTEPIRGEKGEKGDSGDSPTITTTKSGKRTTIYADDSPIGTVDDGADGHTPVITATKSGKVTTIKADGTIIAEINDGNDGATGATGASGSDGKDGKDGADGFSPTATVSKSGSTTTITITDKNGTTTAEVHDGQGGTGTIDPTPTEGSTNAVSSGGVYDELTDLKSDLNKSASVMDSNATNVDVDITDASGNVILRLSDGHVKTKNFDSSNIAEKLDTNQGTENAGKAMVVGSDGNLAPADVAIEVDDTLSQEGQAADAKAVGDAIAEIGTGTSSAYMAVSDASDVDVDITDQSGNVILRLADGNIKTKKFDSENIKGAIETLSASKTYVRGAVNTITVAHEFSKGDKIYFHLDDGSRYDAYGQFATYYQGSTVIYSDRRGSNAYVPHVITQDCQSVGITIGGTEYANGTELTLYVYIVHGEVEPKVITVKADGTGMFSTIKAAVDSITDANHVSNPYVIEVYPGTYNTLEGFTDAEIRSADIGGGYTQDSMVGVKLTDGISMIGMGTADEVILTAELSTSTYNPSIRGNISTLNLEGEGRLENMTIVGKNLRYCIHDDFVSPVNSHDKRVLRNLKFRGENLAYAPLFTSYGAGMSAPRDYLIENCDFGYDLGIHSVNGQKFGCTIEVNNCTGNRFRVGDYAGAESDGVHRVIINDCDFQVIRINHADNSLSTHMTIEGTGCANAMIKDAVGSMYKLGMVDLAAKGFTTGQMVQRVSGNLTFTASTNPVIAHGIVIGSDDYHCYVQKCGYIASNLLGLTGLAIGDYVTVNGSGIVVSGGTASNAVGVVKAVDEDGIAYIYMLIGGKA